MAKRKKATDYESLVERIDRLEATFEELFTQLEERDNSLARNLSKVTKELNKATMFSGRREATGGRGKGRKRG